MRAWPGVWLLLIAGVCDAREPVVGLPCENCEAVFEDMPAQIASRTSIGTTSEPGEALLITGTVRDARGRAVGGVVVYAYQTDSKGVYPTSGRPTRLSGLQETTRLR